MQAYQKTLTIMLEQNKPLFDEFTLIHEKFKQDPDPWKAEFNKIGGDVVDVIRAYERKLCSKTESGQYGKFSANLSQKFWDALRKLYPKIDFVGIQ